MPEPKLDSQFALKLDERVDDIGERLSAVEVHIESAKEKGLLKHLSEYGGVVALCLSILVGSYTAYDHMIVRPKQAAIDEFNGIRDNIAELSTLTSQIAQLDWTNPTLARSQAGVLTPRKVALVQSVEKYTEQHPGRIGFADRLMLANENEFLNRFDKSLEHAEAALNSAATPLEVANGHWAVARFHARLNNLDPMRENYRTAITGLKQIDFNAYAADIMQAYTQWIAYELASDTSCNSPRSVHEQMQKDFLRPEVWPNTKLIISEQFDLVLSQSKQTCGLSLKS